MHPVQSNKQIPTTFMTGFEDDANSQSYGTFDYRKPSKYNGRTFIKPDDKVVTSVQGMYGFAPAQSRG